MSFRKQASTEPIPGYRLLEPLGQGGYGEVWKCEAPGGLHKAIKIVEGPLADLNDDGAPAGEELQAIERVKRIRHPFLLSIDRVEVVNGELVIVTELADCSLHEVMLQYRQEGLPGIPRSRLLGYLHEAAEVLDLLNQEYDLQHLDIKPRNLFLVRNHVKVGDFGLVSSLTGDGKASPVALGAVTPLYASPEVFSGNISRHSDQYSLAIVYQELLTGKLPFRGKNSRQLLLLHTTTAPDLSPLPEADQPIIAQALAKNPAERFPSCLELVEALAAVSTGREVVSVAADTPLPTARQTSLTARLAERGQDQDTHSPGSITSRSSAENKTTQRSKPRLGSYRFLDCLGSSPLVDVWTVEDPQGQRSLLKFLYAAGGDPRRLDEALRRLQSLHHPLLVPQQVIDSTPGRVVVRSDLHERSLRDLLSEYQQQGHSGVPREEILTLLRPVVETLDYLYRQHSIQHLALNPRNLLLQDDQVVVGDFGLAQLVWLPTGQSLVSLNSRYSAPELSQKKVSPACDQYSLALIIVELLTGVLPQRRGQGCYDLGRVPAADREILVRALSANPTHRWPGCTELIRALEEAGGSKKKSAESRDALAEVVGPNGDRPSLQEPASQESLLALGELLQCLLGQRFQDLRSTPEGAPQLSEDGQTLWHRFSAGVPLGTARLKLDAVREQWYGTLIRDDEQSYTFHINLPTNFWRQWLGRQPGLEVGITLSRHHPLAATPIDVTVTINTFCCPRKRGPQLLRDMGRALIDNLRTVLLIGSEKRVQERVLWPHPVEMIPILPNGSQEKPILCRGKDLSLSGIGFYLPQQIATADVLVRLPGLHENQPIELPAKLVRALRCADGWYEVGALFRLGALTEAGKSN